MEKQKQLAYCKICKNKKFDRKKGIVCGLTDEYPTFQNTCSDFSEDLELVKQEKERQLNSENEEKVRKAIRLTTLSIFAIIVLEIILVYFFNDWRNTRIIISRTFAFLVFSFVLLSTIFNLPFFDYRFKRAIKYWGRERARKMVIIVFSIFIFLLLCIRNF